MLNTGATPEDLREAVRRSFASQRVWEQNPQFHDTWVERACNTEGYTLISAAALLVPLGYRIVHEDELLKDSDRGAVYLVCRFIRNCADVPEEVKAAAKLLDDFTSSTDKAYYDFLAVVGLEESGS